VVLKDESRSERGFVSAEPRQELLGTVGEVLTELRPSGSVRLNGKPVDVVSEGAFVPKGSQVQVVDVQGNRVVVRQV
jgi:membrane-bound serine protease (ClpP class)